MNPTEGPKEYRMAQQSGYHFPAYVMEASHTSIDRHKHDFFELVFVREGYCLHHLNDTVSLVMEGDLLLIKPGIEHRYAGTRECKIYNCLFLPEAFGDDLQKLLTLPGLDRFFLPAADGFPQLHLDFGERKNIRRLLAQMFTECNECAEGWEMRLRALLVCLAIDCSRAYSNHGAPRTERESYSGYVTKALAYIDGHYTHETLSVQEIGAAVGVSGDYLSRQFKRITGVAVQEYVRRYRFARAVESLQQGLSVNDAALCNGFHSISYFSREFKKTMGVMPSHYLKQGE